MSLRLGRSFALALGLALALGALGRDSGFALALGAHFGSSRSLFGSRCLR